MKKTATKKKSASKSKSTAQPSTSKKIKSGKRGLVCILWDLKTRRILTATKYTGTAKTLLASESELGLGIIPASKPMLRTLNISSALRKMSFADLNQHVFYRQANVCIYDPIKPKEIDNVIAQKSELLSSKSRYLNQLTKVISRARMRIAPSEKYAGLIELRRYEQAIALKEKDFKESDLTKYLFVIQFANIKKIDLVSAANEIIFQYELFESALWKTEEIKLKYFDLISQAKSVSETHQLYQEFIREYYLNSHV